MSRKFVFLALALFLPLLVGQAGGRERVLVLLGKSYPQYQQAATAFASEWKRKGSAEAVVLPFPSNESEQSELAGRKPDLVVGLGEAPTTWALGRPERFTVGFTMVVEPERMESYRGDSPVKQRPLVGVSVEVPWEEQVSVVAKMIPTVKRVGVMTQDPALREEVGRLRQACEKHQLELAHVELAAISDLPNKLNELLGEVHLLWTVPDAQVLQPQLAQYMIGQCAARRVPLLGLSSTFVRAGATLSLERDYQEVGELLAQRCLEVREGAAKLTVHSPRRIVVSVNQRAFQTLGLQIELQLPNVTVSRY